MRKDIFTVLCLEGAVLSFNVAACSALVPTIAQYFGVSQYLAGRLVWIYMLPYGVAACLYGPLARLFDIKKIEVVCLTCFSLANLLAAFAGNINLLFAARFFIGLFGASVTPLVLILISRYTDEKNRGKTVGNFFAATYVASLAGLFLSGFAATIPWQTVFIIPGIGGLALAWYMHKNLPEFKDESGLKTNYLAAFKDKTVFTIFTYIFFISLFYHGVQQWLAVYFNQDFGLNQFTISMLITLTSLSGVFGELIGGKFSDKLGRLRTMELGLFLLVGAVLFLFVKFPIGILAVLMIIWGLGWAANHAGLSTALTDLPKKFVNEAASLNSSLRFIAGGLGAALGGVLMQKGSQLNLAVSGLGLVALIFFAAMNNRNLKGGAV